MVPDRKIDDFQRYDSKFNVCQICWRIGFTWKIIALGFFNGNLKHVRHCHKDVCVHQSLTEKETNCTPNSRIKIVCCWKCVIILFSPNSFSGFSMHHANKREELRDRPFWFHLNKDDVLSMASNVIATWSGRFKLNYSFPGWICVSVLVFFLPICRLLFEQVFHWAIKYCAVSNFLLWSS